MNVEKKGMHKDGPARTMNNFDLVRLFAAIQVFIWHGYLFGLLRHTWLVDAIWFFPGVPVFFGMSGFLLLWSFDRNPNLLSYWKNRFLRLFPALWATMGLTMLVLLVSRTIGIRDLLQSGPLLYLAGRCTAIFYFVPQQIRQFVQGDPNGSLWTIGVELQFYLLLPLLFRAIRRQPLLMKNLLLLTIGILSYWLDRSDPELPFDVYRLNGYWRILLSEIRLFYFLFFFVTGMLIYVNYRWLRPLLEGRSGMHLVIYSVICIASFYSMDISKADPYKPDTVSLIRHIFLMLLVFSFVFSQAGLSWKWLKGNDYSYGIYLTHLLVLNTVNALHRWNGLTNFFLSAIITGMLAWASWHFIEKKALRLKKYSLRTMLSRKEKISPVNI